MTLINTTDTIGAFMSTITTETTGSLYLTLILIVIFCYVFCLGFKIPIELSSIIILPLCIGFMLITTEVYSVLSIVILHLAVVVTKFFIAR